VGRSRIRSGSRGPGPEPGRPWIVSGRGHFEGSAPDECRRHDTSSSEGARPKVVVLSSGRIVTRVSMRCEMWSRRDRRLRLSGSRSRSEEMNSKRGRREATSTTPIAFESISCVAPGGTSLPRGRGGSARGDRPGGHLREAGTHPDRGSGVPPGAALPQKRGSGGLSGDRGPVVRSAAGRLGADDSSEGRKARFSSVV